MFKQQKRGEGKFIVELNGVKSQKGDVIGKEMNARRRVQQMSDESWFQGTVGPGPTHLPFPLSPFLLDFLVKHESDSNTLHKYQR